MFSTASINEINGLLGATLSDPHHILGMHEAIIDEKTENERKVLVVRVFVPGASSVTLLDPEDASYELELDLMHTEGFFEAEVKGRTAWFRYMLRITAGANMWTAYDPYSFMPIISEYDLYLFNRGTHYSMYDKLGAKPVTADGVEGVLFTVWAPNAARVSVIGSFNNWDGRRDMMRLLKDSGVWELFVPGLKEYDRYKFEIRTAAGQIMEKSDPYGKFFELRPSKSALIFDIGGYEWGDSEWMEHRDANSPLDGPMNIYEVHIGSWRRNSDGGFMTYRETADALAAYCKNMNYTHVELLPVTEHPYDGSWGYQVTGYFAPTSRYGNPHDFMHFVDTMHQNGIGVIIDWVPAHFPKDSHGLARFDGTALYEHEDPRMGEHPDWGTYIFNYGRNEVSCFLINSALFWLDMYHVDGLRVDAVASLLYLNFGKRSDEYMPNRYGGNINIEATEFIKHMNSVILGKYPNALMIAEESTDWQGVSRPLDQQGLGFSLKWNMGWMNDFLEYISKDPIHRKYHHNNLTFGMMYAYNENFILVLSHDEVVHLKRALIDKMPGDIWRKCANLRVSLSFMYGHPGKKLLFMGGEFGQFAEWSETRSLDWFLLDFQHHRQIQDFVRDLNALYLNERAMWYNDFKDGGFEWIDCNNSDMSTISFIRKGPEPGDSVIQVSNFSAVPLYNYKLRVPQLKTYTEILNSDDLKYGGSGVVNSGSLKAIENTDEPFIEITVPPLGAAFFKTI